MARLGVLLNPHANGGKGLARWKQLLETERARELRSAQVHDGAPAAAPAWFAGELRAGTRRFVAAGGDGTVNLAVNALLDACGAEGVDPRGVALGAVGLGSSNDFHKPYEGRESAGGARLRLDFERAALHDVGTATLDGDKPRRFLINASVGVTAEANHAFNESGALVTALKRSWVDGAIIAVALRTLFTYRNFSAKLSLDEQEARACLLTNLGVVKNVHFSGQMRYDVPQAADDGRFGVHLCEAMGRFEMIKTLAALNSGRFRGLPKTSSQSAKTVKIEAEKPFALETDGEVATGTRAELAALQKAVLLCP